MPRAPSGAASRSANSADAPEVAQRRSRRRISAPLGAAAAAARSRPPSTANAALRRDWRRHSGRRSVSFGQGEGTARGRAPGRGRAGAGRLAESLGPRRPPLRPLGHHRALRGAGGPGAGDWPPRPHESAPPPPPEPRRQQGPDRPRIAQRPGGLGGSGAAPALVACRPAPEIRVAFLRCSAAAAFSGSAAAAARSCSGGGLRGPLRRRCHRRAGPASGPGLRTVRGAAAPSPPLAPARPGRVRRSPTCTAQSRRAGPLARDGAGLRA